MAREVYARNTSDKKSIVGRGGAKLWRVIGEVWVNRCKSRSKNAGLR